MARYTLPERVATITFDGTDFAGAEVTLRIGLPYRTVMEVQQLGAGLTESLSLQAMGALTELFADRVLVRWNLSDDGGIELPCTATAFDDLPMDFLALIFTGWLDAMGMSGNAEANTDSPLVNGRVDDLTAQAVTGG